VVYQNFNFGKNSLTKRPKAVTVPIQPEDETMYCSQRRGPRECFFCDALVLPRSPWWEISKPGAMITKRICTKCYSKHRKPH
jgi:hypothetical protein